MQTRIFSNNNGVVVNPITSFEEFKLFSGLGPTFAKSAFYFDKQSTLSGHITIPDGITTITAHRLFAETGLESVYYNNVTTMTANDLFSGCKNLKAVFYGINTTQFQTNGINLPNSITTTPGVAVYMGKTVPTVSSSYSIWGFGDKKWKIYVLPDMIQTW
jgi:hypothetical protein